MAKKVSKKIRSAKELSNLGLGGQGTKYPQSYSPKLLERFENKNPKNAAWTSFVCTEFTSLCPKTNQPDFARIYINYVADKWMIESKSLKLYLFSFRNHGDFHEDCVQKICDDISNLISPHYLEVIGEFTPRGGIAIYPFASHASKKKNYQELKNHRFLNYRPGQYSLELSRVY